jgi:membrane-associated phospholipid phosphatase
MNRSTRRICVAVLAVALQGAVMASRAQAPAGPTPETSSEQVPPKGLVADIEAYYTAPLRWDGGEWLLFGGALGAVALAHNYDRQVRTHFVDNSSTALSTKNEKDLEDWAPSVVLLGGTGLFALISDDRESRSVTWAMAEAAGLSTVTGYALKFAAGRERPDETTDPNRWREGGSSFPSEHAVAAFAIGTVFAESGNGGYRWLTRLVGYGMAAWTGYARLKHNSHWLSDVVAGAALGSSTAAFVVNRNYGRHLFSGVTVVPIERGVLVTYSTHLD